MECLSPQFIVQLESILHQFWALTLVVVVIIDNLDSIQQQQ